MRYSPVLNKRDFVKRYKKGEFGNAAPTWSSVTAFKKAYALEWPTKDQLFHLRSKEPGGPTYYNLTFKKLLSKKNTENYYVSAMAPTAKTIIQGEIRQSIKHLELRYTTVKKPMRDAFKVEDKTIFGLQVNYVVSSCLDANSQDWLFVLLDRYPNHIIEFSTYSTQWGTVPGYNTVFWEVRPDRGIGSELSKYKEIY
tara:strand:- start:54447 stop:55037 length:591 start_codon:yes stop_codon:yes gene_type:complete